MLVSHSFNLKEIQQEVDDPRILLNNGTGSYALLGETPTSRYDGFFYYDPQKEEMFRVIEDIRLGSAFDLKEIIDHSDYVERFHGKVSELISMPRGHPALIYELSADTDIKVTLDVKRSYDNREYGRHYEIAKEKDALVIRFIKRTDRREDPTDGEEEFELYLVVYAEDLDFSFTNHWFRRSYSLDAERVSLPSERYVLDALRLRVKKCVFYAGRDKDACYREARRIYREHLSTRDGKPMHSEYDDIRSFPHKIALYRAGRSLLGNVIDGKSIFAGLPWFFQYWARDTGYCLQALLELDKKNLVKHIIREHLDRIDYEGQIPNRIPATTAGSADAVGIFADRLGKLLETDVLFTKSELDHLTERLQHATYLLRKFRLRDGLAVNDAKATWMDTDYDGDDRSGMRIEIQALRLRLYDVLYGLTKDLEYEKMVQEGKRRVRKAFFRKGKLYDAPNDPTQRPNIFLAAYFFPRLFKPREWETIIDHALTELWLPWGGLSSIAKSHPLYTDQNTGEDPRSYHHGDSWYFINNIAAMVMLRLDRHKYAEQIGKILEASTQDMLWGGAIGHGSELSSAARQTHQGCLAQSWTAATYIELIHAYHLVRRGKT
ncbi:MAG: hypothetical protein GXP63_00975 [DPANN group archaeon]|nr:hypothetical protein [DPANN group archaeon]